MESTQSELKNDWSFCLCPFRPLETTRFVFFVVSVVVVVVALVVALVVSLVVVVVVVVVVRVLSLEIARGFRRRDTSRDVPALFSPSLLVCQFFCPFVHVRVSVTLRSPLLCSASFAFVSNFFCPLLCRSRHGLPEHVNRSARNNCKFFALNGTRTQRPWDLSTTTIVRPSAISWLVRLVVDGFWKHLGRNQYTGSVLLELCTMLREPPYNSLIMVILERTAQEHW